MKVLVADACRKLVRLQEDQVVKLRRSVSASDAELLSVSL